MTATAENSFFLRMKSGESLNVLLSVTGENRTADSDESETVRVVTVGKYTRLPEGWKLQYTESDPDGTASQEIVLTLTGEQAVMERAGAYSTTMVFEKGRRFDGTYHTPWGGLAMGVYTTQVLFTCEKEQGVLKLVYQVDIQGQFAAMHDLTIRFASNE